MKSTIPGPDDLDQVERQLFQSLSGDDPPKRAHRAAAAALGLGSATLTSATAGGASVGAKAAGLLAAKSGTLLLVKWVGIGTLVGAVSVGTIRYASRAAPSAATRALAAPSPRDSLANAPAPVAEPARTEPIVPPVEPPPVVATRRAAPLQAPAPVSRPRDVAPSVPANVPQSAPVEATGVDTASTTHPARPASMLAAEVASLDEVRRALVAKDGERALAQLRRHARDFPAPTLNLEATVLRIEALFLAGQTQAARDLGREFLASQPNSTHASRVRHLLAEHEKP